MTRYTLARLYIALLIGVLLSFAACDDDAPNEPVNPYTDTLILRDFEYAERRIFDLGDSDDFSVGDSIQRLIVFQKMPQVGGFLPPDAVYAIMYVDPDHPDQDSAETVNLGDNLDDGAVPLELTAYEWFTRPDSNRHRLVFLAQPLNLSFGVYMEIRRADGSVDTVGHNGAGTIEDSKKLKLIYNDDASPSHKTWPLMWRNAYPIPRGLTSDDFDVKVYRGLVGTENTPATKDYQITGEGQQSYLEILGLDQYDATGTARMPDGRIDDLLTIVRPDWGLIIFPARQPFNSDTTFADANGHQTQRLEIMVPGLYNYESQTERSQSSYYFLRVYLRQAQPAH